MQKPEIMRLPLTIGAYSSGVAELTLTPPDHVEVAAIGLSVDSKAALYDHEVTEFTHNDYDAITTSEVGGTSYGVPLGHLASHVGAVTLSSVDVHCRKLKPWPGRFGDWNQLAWKAAQGVALSEFEQLRLEMGLRFGCGDFTIMPIHKNRKIKLTVKRIFGSTSITRAYLWCIVYPKASRPRMCDGRKNLIDLPHWLGQAASLTAAAGVQDSIQCKWDRYDDYGLSVRHLFAQAHADEDSTITYEIPHLEAINARLKFANGARMFPDYADQRQNIVEFSSQILQHADCWRRLDFDMPAHSSLLIEPEVTASDHIKVLRASFYGLLKPQSESGELVDASA